MFCYQKNFSNPTLPVDEAQFYALVRAKQWNENIDKYRETGEACLAETICHPIDGPRGDGYRPCG